eukprot:scaffold2958_cov162-Skeletonema_dohrnii-CCMP3373.AAC.4
MMTPSWPDAVAGETKETSDNSRHLSHQDHDHDVPTASTKIIVQNQNNVVVSRLLVATFRFVKKYTTFLTCPRHKYKAVLVLDMLTTFVKMMVSREDVETRSLNASDMLYDSPLATGKTKKEEEEEAEPPTTNTSGDVLESRVRGCSCKSRRPTCPEMSTFEHGKLDSILHDSSYHDGCAPTAPREDDGSLLTETKVKEAVGDILPADNHTWRLRYSIRQPSRLKDHLAQSWHPTSRTASLDADLSVQPKHCEREEIKERQNLKKQSRSILLRQLRPSWQSFRLGNELDSVQMDQIQIIDDDKVHPSRKNLHWWHTILFFSIISLLICLLQLVLPPPYGLMMTSAEVGEVGIAPGCEDDMKRCICPRETICVTDTLSIILLALARCSAFFDYPLYMMLFLSKAHNLNNHLRRTLLREWIDFGDMHKVHKIFGIVVGIETMFHSFFHLLRWGLNNEMRLGRTGHQHRMSISCAHGSQNINGMRSRCSLTLQKRIILCSASELVAIGVGNCTTRSKYLVNDSCRKRITIIWGCRDPGLIEYILRKVDISAITRNSFAFIFYTGRRELALPNNLPVNVFIFNSRPDLENTITGIITAIHSGEGLPEELYEKQKKIANAPFRKRMMIAMTRVINVYD